MENKGMLENILLILSKNNKFVLTSFKESISGLGLFVISI